MSVSGSGVAAEGGADLLRGGRGAGRALPSRQEACLQRVTCCLSPQSRYRILVEILDENDNKPKFLEETIRPLTVSEVKGSEQTRML